MHANLLQRPAHQRLAPERLARVFVLLVGSSILGVAAWHVQLARDLALQDGRTEAASLARSLAEQAHATVEAAGIVTADLVERLEHDGASSAAAGRLHGYMAARVAAASPVRDLVVCRADGGLLSSSASAALLGCDWAREALAFHSTRADRGVYIGPPLQEPTSGRWMLNVSRRFDQPDGAFAGVALATIDLDELAAFYRSFDIGAHGAVTLASDDGILLVRVPARPDLIGRSLAGNGFLTDRRGHDPAADARATSQVDGIVRWTSFRRVNAYPLVVFAGLSEQDILAGWWQSACTTMAVSCAVALALGLLGWRFADRIRWQRLAEGSAHRNEEQFRLLADNGTDLITQFGPDRQCTYVSPASERLLGYLPEELIGCDANEAVHPDDLQVFTANRDTLFGYGEAPPVSYRARRKDGSFVWVEAAGRKLADGPNFVIAIRDVTQRKEIEAQLHQANNQLQRLTMLDGLTGIANRRCFDTALQKEVRRATRAELPLALLMIDVDHFRLFNDLHGHSAGDTCLRAIANAIGGQMHRPADLAARYGGEEFAVVLPETGEAGALALAQRVREAVRSLGIAHRGNPGGIATVSVGVATAWSLREQGQSAQDLVAMADKALLQAKAAGRDRVHPETWTTLNGAGIEAGAKARRTLPELVFHAAP